VNAATAADHPSRLPEEPPHLVDDPPVSGRSELRPLPLPEGFAHDVRFSGAVQGIRAYCQPCHWGIWIDDGHDLTDLIRLVAQHCGVGTATAMTADTLIEILEKFVTP
jgi:hypothetical protein